MCVICCLSLAAFNSCSLCLIFVSLINMFLGVFHLGFILFGTLSFLDLGGYFLPHFRKLFNYYLLKYFLMVFLFVFVFWDSYDSNVGTFDIVPEVSEVVLISFNSFFFSATFISTILSSTSLILSSVSVILLLVLSRVLFHLLLHYLLLIDSFISSMSLLNISCIFSILVSRLFICNSILFSRFWIIFTIIIWNSLSGRFPISSSFLLFGGHLSCSFVCWVFICLSSCLCCCVWGGLLFAGSLWFLFIVEVPPHQCGWMSGLLVFPG